MIIRQLYKVCQIRILSYFFTRLWRAFICCQQAEKSTPTLFFHNLTYMEGKHLQGSF
ncbi:hypothetical protein PI172_2305 [Prevotella intermedia]|uniref:Uncharacterized protein n=1 Tax=Prevotella intermedia TaxID=28131 RepID=A0AAD1BKL1_PREIN|nr:hypothetical protein PI172_2305 [Prevotella intermedia]